MSTADAVDSHGLLDGFDEALAGVTEADVVRPAEAKDGSGATPAVPASGDEVTSTPARELAERLLRRSNATTVDRWQLIGAPPARSVVITDAVVIGRGADEGDDTTARLSSTCAHVSRRHCMVSTRSDGTVRLEVAELGSANGTVVLRGDNTIPVGDDPVELVDGDAIATADGLLTIATVRRVGGAA